MSATIRSVFAILLVATAAAVAQQLPAAAPSLTPGDPLPVLHRELEVEVNGAINIRGLNHSKRVFDLTEGLIRRGYSDAQIAQVLGGNAICVLGTIWPA